MGQDNQPKHRQKARDLRRRAASRRPYQRVLIVTEGEKTEPRYLDEIRTELRLASAHVLVRPGGYGTAPLKLVQYAERLVREGDRSSGIGRGAFDCVFVVFDRDDHNTYHQALDKARALNGRLRNDEHMCVGFEAIASVPCFELWLLLHFQDVQAPMHRDAVSSALRQYLPSYSKGQGGHWAATKGLLEVATQRALVRAGTTSAYDGQEPFTAMHRLVGLLVHLTKSEIRAKSA